MVPLGSAGFNAETRVLPLWDLLLNWLVLFCIFLEGCNGMTYLLVGVILKPYRYHMVSL